MFSVQLSAARLKFHTAGARPQKAGHVCLLDGGRGKNSRRVRGDITLQIMHASAIHAQRNVHISIKDALRIKM